ncbi:DMT family transporter [Massilia sp. 9096]|uniref:DMT family transporter n=1 Tax=Massilia sp. 9096 TaxID=1500894 RepID=UPI000AC44439|nr:DMT family transporter [Massilia sp. 9096]
MSAEAGARLKGNLRSIQAMLLAVVAFSIMDTMMKLLAAEFPPMQVAALRGLSSLPLVCAYVAWRGAFKGILRVRWPLHILRGVIGIAMLALFAYGVNTLSLAEAYTIYFVGPILITALSAPVLGERVNGARWIAIAIGMAGVLVVLRPSGAGFLSVGGLAVLASAIGYAVSAVAGRILARSDRAEHMVFWVMLMMGLGAAVLAAPSWVPLQARHVPLLAALAVSGFVAQLALTEAFSHGEASVVAPFEYTALAWGVAIDWLMWKTLPDGFTLLGAAIIIGSGLYLIRHETVHAQA